MEDAVTEVDAHEEVGSGKITDEESRNIHLAACDDEDGDDGAIPEQGHEEYQPHPTAKGPPIEQVSAGQKGSWPRNALDGRPRLGQDSSGQRRLLPVPEVILCIRRQV